MSVARRQADTSERPLTEARERLAGAIAAHDANVAEIEAINAAQADMQQKRFAARRAVEAALVVETQSKANVAKFIVGKALGTADTPPTTQRQAQWKVIEAEEHLEEVVAASALLTQQLGRANESMIISKMKSNDALKGVLVTSPEVAKLLGLYRAKLGEIDVMRHALSFLWGKGAVATGWDCESNRQDLSLLSTWQAAWAALEKDAGAALPQ